MIRRWGKRLMVWGGVAVIAGGIGLWYKTASQVHPPDPAPPSVRPTNSEMISRRGQYMYQKKIILTQVAVYKKAMGTGMGDDSAIRQKLAGAFRQLAQAAHGVGVENEARAYFKELLAYSPNDPEALEFLTLPDAKERVE